MRKALFVLMTSVFGLSTAQGQIIYTEDFAGCALPTDWQNVAVTGPNSWLFGNNINNLNAPNGGSVDGTCFAYIDDDALGSSAPFLEADLIMAEMDMSSYNNAEFHFNYIFQNISGSFLSVSFWNGSSWDVVWTEDSDPGCFGFFPTCSPRQASISMIGYLNADFRAKFTYDDNNSWGWWAALDSVSVFLPPAHDAVLADIISPKSGCGLGDEEVSIAVYNNSQNDITEVISGYAVGGGAWVTETFSVNIVPGDTAIITFATPADLSALGNLNFSAFIEVADDLDLSNDTMETVITNIPVLGASLPYLEDFENGDGGWSVAGTNSSWQLGQPSAAFIDAAFSGINAWVTNPQGFYNVSENSYIESPCMDFSALVIDPVLRFQHIYNTEACCDEGWVDISYDGGVTYSRLGTAGSGDNWYNDAGNNWWDGNSGDSTVWRTAEHLLDGAAGESSVKIRFFFSSDGSVNREGFGVDDIEIFEQPPFNAGVTNVLSPITGCDLGVVEVTVVIENFGSEDLTGFDVSFDDGNGAVTEQYSDVLAIGQVDTFTFATPLDLTSITDLNLSAWTDLTDDGDLSNDTTWVSITNSPVVNIFPYNEGFESGSGGWHTMSVSAENSWQLGEPAGTFITGAAEGDNAWVTNLTGQYAINETSYLVSPCFDFSAVPLDPFFRFSHIFTTESCCDEGWVDISFDGGQTWQKLGQSITGENWYNDADNNWWDGVSGDVGQWREAMHPLVGAAGESSVRLRFVLSSDFSQNADGFGVDGIRVEEQPADNGAVQALLSPTSACELSDSEVITVTVANLGSELIDPVSISYQVNGGAVVTQQWDTIISSLDAATFSFDQTVDISTPADYSVAVWVNVPGDGDTSNDTLTVVVQSIPVITDVPYFQDFENGTGGWGSTGNFGVWELGDPVGTLINTAYSGTNAWATNLNTLNYVNFQVSYLTSPCMDFSALEHDPILEFAITRSTEPGYDGCTVEISTNGGATWSILGNVGEGVNWYNNPVNNWWDANSEWVIASHIMEGVAGQSNVRFRYVFVADFIVNAYEGVAIDDIRIHPQPLLDLATVSFDGPKDGCALGQNPVTFTFWNQGVNTVSDFTVGFSVDGGPVQTETVAGPMMQGDTLTYTFTTELADLSTDGPHTIDVFTMLSGDEAVGNDSLPGSDVFNYGNDPVLEQGFDSGSGSGPTISATLANGTSSTIYFCGFNTGLDPACFTIDNVTLGSIPHTWLSDLEIYLISPAGDTLLLSSGNGGSGENIVDVVFNGDSDNDITQQTSGILPGTYAPEDEDGFEMFYDGQDPNGGWTLFIRDVFSVDDGSIDEWSMTFVDHTPVVELSYDDTTICYNGEMVVSVSGDYDSQLWSTGHNSATAVLSGSSLGVGTHEISVLVDKDGCTGQSNSFTLTVEECVGIAEVRELEFGLRPNPTDGLLTVSTGADHVDVTAEVLDLQGRVLMTLSLGTVSAHVGITIDVKALASGIYAVRMRADEAVGTLRFVKQ